MVFYSVYMDPYLLASVCVGKGNGMMASQPTFLIKHLLTMRSCLLMAETCGQHHLLMMSLQQVTFNSNQD